LTLEVLSTFSEMVETHLEDVVSICRRLGNDVNSVKEKKRRPFNLILAGSDLFYRENFHSDLIAAILERDTFFKHFLQWVGENGSVQLDPSNYSARKVATEEGKIDILVSDEASKHCIIIENKINNACDMPRQLPRYIERQISHGFHVDAVLYVSLDGAKRPDRMSWSPSDQLIVSNQTVVYLAVSNQTECDLVNGFLKKCIADDCTVEEFSFIRQYIDLVEYLGRNQMDMALMEKFYGQMLETRNYKSAQSLRSMLNHLISFRRERLYNFFVNKSAPFDTIARFASDDTLFIGLRRVSPDQIKLDIISEENFTRLEFWIQNSSSPDFDLIGDILSQTSLGNSFERKSTNSYQKLFAFPEEEKELYEFVTKLLTELTLVCEQRPSNI
jgi:PD-(D/E)XK nuclease superfamily